MHRLRVDYTGASGVEVLWLVSRAESFSTSHFYSRSKVVSATNPCHEYVRKLDLKCEAEDCHGKAMCL